MKKSIFMFACTLFAANLMAQYDGDGGTEGSKAISKEDASIVAWAKGVEFDRTSEVTYGKPYDAIGMADTTNLVCVSLGNGGTAVATFDRPIVNKDGFDFAVFENAFDSTFMELAFVEVSSDGVNYFRFPSKSSATEDKTTQTTSHYYNLAGKYSYKYGVGFDLSELEDNALLDKNNVRFVRLVDVQGGVDKDSQGNIIYEYDEHSFLHASGFDLSGIAVINGGEPYTVADMEGLLTQNNTYELASSINFDESLSETVKEKNYTSGDLYFKGVAVIGEGYEMAIGWGLSNVSDTSAMQPTGESGMGWCNNYYVSSSMTGVSGQNTGYLHGYYSEYNSEEHLSVFSKDNNTFKPIGVYVSQSLASFLYPSTDATENGWFKVIATGYDAEGNATNTAEVYLINFAKDENGKELGNYSEWRYMNLEPLGEVAKVKFSLASNYAGSWGLNIPAYFCIDEFTYTKVNKNSLASEGNAENAANISLYPNPASDVVTIDGCKDRTVRIFDTFGRVVYTNNCAENTVEIRSLTSGIYFVSVQSAEDTITKKLIIK